jgi:hypothetical protein
MVSNKVPSRSMMSHTENVVTIINCSNMTDQPFSSVQDVTDTVSKPLSTFVMNSPHLEVFFLFQVVFSLHYPSFIAHFD